MRTYLTVLFNLLFSTKLSTNTGLQPDPRTPDQKANDYLYEESAVSTPVPTPFGFAKILTLPIAALNQNSTSSCVLHALGLAERIERKADTGLAITYAPIFAYRLRANYPAEGTYPQNGADIISNFGLPPAASLPTPQSEAAANAVVITPALLNEAAPYKGKSYWSLGDPSSIEAIANIAAQGHAVAICIFATYAEYAQVYPQILVPDLRQGTPEAVVSHCICVLPYSGFIENGIKYVAIQDSAWFGGFKLRYVSEDFIKARCYSAVYWDTVGELEGGTRPSFHFTQTLNVGDKGKEVEQMQLLLIAEKVLPAGNATGYFGGLTLAAVRDFQQKYAEDILVPRQLTLPTSSWAGGCIAKANALCG